MKNIFQTILIFIFIITLSYQGSAQPGFLDPTFGNNGIVIEKRVGGTSGLAILPDEKILIAGSGENFYLDRFNPDGSNDASFGIDGRVNINLDDKHAVCYSMAIQQDGKIILVGAMDAAISAYTDLAIVRCKTDGSLDSSFGINGYVTFNFKNFDYAYDVAIQSDNKIVVIGDNSNSLAQNNDSYILRLNTDGSLDQSFGVNGITKTHYASSSTNVKVIVQPDGKLIMGGTYAKKGLKPDYMVQRFNIDGTVDNSFGENGTAKFKFGEGQASGWLNELFDIALQPDGKIVCAGEAGLDLVSMAMCRFNADGSMDNSFGDNGGKILDYNNH